ncbi:MAG: Mth938-like domain-containing protein [Pseudorhodoplanes sp.]|uniref:Mth938-like domain-containing protein n=1 Tax=Pseudorhodoplanes sp. TaxID=1934341 RepID=UPI003D123BBE
MDGRGKTPHYPRLAPIDSYGRGGFRFAGMSHRGSLLLLPSGIWAWPVTEPSAITAETLAAVMSDADRIGLLLIGTGVARSPLPDELMRRLAAHGISVETSRTGQAANTYNILLEEGRRVAAALIAVD